MQPSTLAEGNKLSYHTIPQIYSDLTALETRFPTKITHESIGKTVGGKDILLWKIGNPDGGRVMFSNVHSNEKTGTEIYLMYAHWLLENKEPGVSDRILKRNYTLLAPTINVDQQGRGNKNNVNLNRNFPKSWRTDCTILGTPDPTTGQCPTGQENIYGYCYKSGCACAWSDRPDLEHYRGIGPGSEPETQAMLSALQKWKPKFFLDYHTWVDPPAFWKPSWRSGINATDRAYHDALIDKVKALATKRNVRVYSYGQTGICGAMIDNAYASAVTTAFMLEGLGKNECGGYINPPYSLITDVAWPAFLPFAIAASQECELPVAPTPVLPILAGLGGFLLVAGIVFVVQRR